MNIYHKLIQKFNNPQPATTVFDTPTAHIAKETPSPSQWARKSPGLTIVVLQNIGIDTQEQLNKRQEKNG